MPSIVPMMSAMRFDEELISSIVETTWATTAPPRSATAAADAASWLAWRAESADCLTVPVSCSIDEAACCRLAAVCSVRVLRSRLPVAISALAVSMLSLDLRTWLTVLLRLSCIATSERSRRAASSWREVSMSRVVRSPPAMTIAGCSARSIGVQMECELTRVSGTIANIAAASVAPISIVTRSEVCCMPRALAATAASMFAASATSPFCASSYSGCTLPVKAAATRAESKPMASSCFATGKKPSRNLSKCAIAAAS